MRHLHRRLQKIEKSRHRDSLPALAMGRMCFYCGKIVTLDDDAECGHHELLPDAMVRLCLRHVIGPDGEPVPPLPGVHRTINVKHSITQNAV